jgi:hypothetical protein
VQLDPRWCLPSKLADNPLVWMIEVDGFVVDVGTMPRSARRSAPPRPDSVCALPPFSDAARQVVSR